MLWQIQRDRHLFRVACLVIPRRTKVPSSMDGPHWSEEAVELAIHMDGGGLTGICSIIGHFRAISSFLLPSPSPSALSSGEREQCVVRKESASFRCHSEATSHELSAWSEGTRLQDAKRAIAQKPQQPTTPGLRGGEDGVSCRQPATITHNNLFPTGWTRPHAPPGRQNVTEKWHPLPYPLTPQFRVTFFRVDGPTISAKTGKSRTSRDRRI